MAQFAQEVLGLKVVEASWTSVRVMWLGQWERIKLDDRLRVLRDLSGNRSLFSWRELVRGMDEIMEG